MNKNYPLNSNIFNEKEFLHSYATGTPDPQSNDGNELISTSLPPTKSLEAREKNEVLTDQNIR